MFDDHEAMILEWRAWRSMCEELKSLGIDVNADSSDRMVRSIKRWGEELVALRLEQDEHIRDEALNEVRGMYPELVV
jgi:hypothetical protein